jgi:acyl-CoA synthetase (AMP-forming)/AMP-acid ligase II
MKILAGSELYWAARQYSGQVSLIFGDQRVTFDQVDARTNRLANGLLGLGLQREDRVAVLLNNSLESVETIFSAAKAGLTYVALNARHTATEHAEILRDSGASAIIVGPEFEKISKEAIAGAPDVRHVIALDGAENVLSYEDLISSASDAPPSIWLDDSTATRIVYTSGTTGKAKGIRYSYARFMRRLENFYCALEYRLGVEDSMIHVGPLTHAAGNYLVPYYLRGAQNIILRRFDPNDFLKTIEAEKVTQLLLVPTMIVRMLDHVEREGLQYDLSSLTCINYGTASTPVHVLHRAVEIFGPIFRQHFGMSECPQPLTLLYPHEHALEGGEVSRLASCGRPTMNVRITIRDENGDEMPAGEPGEIAIAAEGVSDVEYWNRPGLREQTVRDGWFYSGDIGRMDEAGFLYIVGRSKDMIVTGGFNVYAREVEDALLQNSDVSDAAVVGRPDNEWGEVIVAALVMRDGTDVPVYEIKESCRPYMAGYKIPREIVFVDNIPRNASGKTDKFLLKKTLLTDQKITDQKTIENAG